ERYLATFDTELQTDLENHIYTKYIDLKAENVSNIQILRGIFKIYVPDGQSNNPSYVNMAQAFVLLFFEDCTIFEKTEDEVSKQGDLFSSL
ncbi:MAG: hypothetical protein RIF34_06535, partial [Candidatus Kapaibacterium sp.]